MMMIQDDRVLIIFIYTRTLKPFIGNIGPYIHIKSELGWF